MVVNSGQLRHRVTIQLRTKTETYQGVDESWATVETRWARVTKISTKGEAEFFQVGLPDVQYMVIFRGDVTLSMRNNRLVWNSEYYELVRPPKDPDGLGNNTTVEIRKVVRGGN